MARRLSLYSLKCRTTWDLATFSLCKNKKLVQCSPEYRTYIMSPGVGLPTVCLLLFFCLIPHIPGLLAKSAAPSPGRTSSSELLLPPHTNSSSLFSKTPVNDWESFAYPISGTIQILKGRIFTSRRVTPDSLRFMIEGGIFSTLREIAILGNTRLRDEDNPYTYRVPGCYFDFRSKTSGKQPMMTYGMLGDVFMALEQVLEKAQRNFETSFVLTDEDRVTWGHGQVLTKAP